MNEFEKCISKGLLRKIASSPEKAKQSLVKSGKWLEEARKNFASESFDSCLVSAYTSMFHAARAILIRDGFREKSHYCVARYVEEKYMKAKKLEEKWINLLDRYRDLRHEDQYDVNFFATEADARNSLEFAEKFLERMRKLL